MSESEEYEDEIEDGISSNDIIEEVGWVDKNPLKLELIQSSLSEVQKTVYGNGYAYSKLLLKVIFSKYSGEKNNFIRRRNLEICAYSIY